MDLKRFYIGDPAEHWKIPKPPFVMAAGAGGFGMAIYLLLATTVPTLLGSAVDNGWDLLWLTGMAGMALSWSIPTLFRCRGRLASVFQWASIAVVWIGAIGSGVVAPADSGMGNLFPWNITGGDALVILSTWALFSAGSIPVYLVVRLLTHLRPLSGKGIKARVQRRETAQV